MHTRNKNTILNFASAKRNSGTATYEIQDILVDVTVALNGKSIELQPMYAVGSEGTILALA
jgi:hypothetical protein